MMKRLLSLCLVVALLLGVSGCSKKTGSTNGSTETTPATKKSMDPALKTLVSTGLTTGLQIATNDGLKAWGKKDAKAAKLAASLLTTNLNNTVLPYLNNEGNLDTGTMLLTVVKSGVFKGLNNSDLQAEITLAMAVLDYYSKVPDCPQSDYIDLVKAALTGITNGCQAYLDSNQ